MRSWSPTDLRVTCPLCKASAPVEGSRSLPEQDSPDLRVAEHPDPHDALPSCDAVRCAAAGLTVRLVVMLARAPLSQEGVSHV